MSSPFICRALDGYGCPIPGVLITAHLGQSPTLSAQTDADGFVGIWTSQSDRDRREVICFQKCSDFTLTFALPSARSRSPNELPRHFLHAYIHLDPQSDCSLTLHLTSTTTYFLEYNFMPLTPLAPDEEKMEGKPESGISRQETMN